ncbi:hypothetical protein [Pseudoxanthomonas spadix]|uniref:hypothetical protein n=1 Tax=Pseudoxanthomonas spadix TaxID=415229 RepID=UPI000EFE9BE4|nr:hypothetical protein [Pseudoxanthomonas spadix]MBP3975705.1 hypothetical protein [Pseudoxanthomonas spadix]RMW95242.1 hypothetical protein D9R12_10030 [Pseudoxanthomonas spadix]
MKRILSGALCALALLGCTDRQAQLQEQAARQAAAKAQAADTLAGQFEAAYAAGNWDLARVHGSALLQQYPDTAAAQKIQAHYEEAKAKAEQAREARRLAGLWTYNQVMIGQGAQVSAAIMSRAPLDTDGSGKQQPVQLVFRDHPEWKRSAYLVLKAGDFPCLQGCKVKVTVDDGKPRAMDAWRPDTDEAIALFITDYKALWKLAAHARTLKIAFPVKAGGTRTAAFDTGGLDPAQMPGWDAGA